MTGSSIAGERARKYTAEEIEAGLALALEDRNMEAVVDLLRVLAVIAPDHAHLILTLFQATAPGRGAA